MSDFILFISQLSIFFAKDKMFPVSESVTSNINCAFFVIAFESKEERCTTSLFTSTLCSATMAMLQIHTVIVNICVEQRLSGA